MLLLGIVKYPLQSAKEVATRIMNIPRLPEIIRSKGTYGYTTKEGVVAFTIYEFDSNQTDEALQAINNANTRLYDVPGINIELIPIFKGRETAKRLLELVS